MESDQPQFTVNQRYPVYFPELRPFFLENANYFLHSDQPDVYAQHRASGVRRARDRQDRPHEHGLVCHRRPGARADGGARRSRSTTTAQRLQWGASPRIWAKGSSIGAIYTDEEFGGGWNRIGGRRLHRADERQVDGAGTDGGKLDQRHSGQRNVRRLMPPARRATCKLQRNGHVFNSTVVIPGLQHRLSNPVGVHSDREYSQRPNPHNLSVVSKARNDPELGLEENQNVAFDHQGQSRLSLLVLRPVHPSAAQHRAWRPSLARTPNSGAAGRILADEEQELH